eukprot:Hpha_TRINITY_DN30350_c0_g1::TRINITY_DN30350_c0_g1_i1::g.146994::m.146994
MYDVVRNVSPRRSPRRHESIRSDPYLECPQRSLSPIRHPSGSAAAAFLAARSVPGPRAYSREWRLPTPSPPAVPPAPEGVVSPSRLDVAPLRYSLPRQPPRQAAARRSRTVELPPPRRSKQRVSQCSGSDEPLLLRAMGEVSNALSPVRASRTPRDPSKSRHRSLSPRNVQTSRPACYRSTSAGAKTRGWSSIRSIRRTAELVVGDSVAVTTDVTAAQELCARVGIPCGQPKLLFLGRTGTVAEVDRSDDTARVHFEGGYTNWWPLKALTARNGATPLRRRRRPPDAFSGDERLRGKPLSAGSDILLQSVEVMRESGNLLERLCRHSGLWSPSRAAYAGRVGTLLEIDDTRATARVSFEPPGVQQWWPFGALRLQSTGAAIPVFARGGVAPPDVTEIARARVQFWHRRRTARITAVISGLAAAVAALQKRWIVGDASAAAGTAASICIVLLHEVRRRRRGRSASPPRKPLADPYGRPPWDTRTRRKSANTSVLIRNAARDRLELPR